MIENEQTWNWFSVQLFQLFSAALESNWNVRDWKFAESYEFIKMFLSSKFNLIFTLPINWFTKYHRNCIYSVWSNYTYCNIIYNYYYFQLHPVLLLAVIQWKRGLFPQGNIYWKVRMTIFFHLVELYLHFPTRLYRVQRDNFAYVYYY